MSNESKENREKRLGKALRANLRKRKTQARGKKQDQQTVLPPLGDANSEND